MPLSTCFSSVTRQGLARFQQSWQILCSLWRFAIGRKEGDFDVVFSCYMFGLLLIAMLVITWAAPQTRCEISIRYRRKSNHLQNGRMSSERCILKGLCGLALGLPQGT